MDEINWEKEKLEIDKSIQEYEKREREKQIDEAIRQSEERQKNPPDQFDELEEIRRQGVINRDQTHGFPAGPADNFDKREISVGDQVKR